MISFTVRNTGIDKQPSDKSEKPMVLDGKCVETDKYFAMDADQVKSS